MAISCSVTLDEYRACETSLAFFTGLTKTYSFSSPLAGLAGRSETLISDVNSRFNARKMSR